MESLSEASVGRLRGVWIQPALAATLLWGTAISTHTADTVPNTTRDHFAAFPRELATVSDSEGLASFPKGPTSPGHSEEQRERRGSPEAQATSP